MKHKIQRTITSMVVDTKPIFNIHVLVESEKLPHDVGAMLVNFLSCSLFVYLFSRVPAILLSKACAYCVSPVRNRVLFTTDLQTSGPVFYSVVLTTSTPRPFGARLSPKSVRQRTVKLTRANARVRMRYTRGGALIRDRSDLTVFVCLFP